MMLLLVALAVRHAKAQCPPLAKEEPRSNHLQCTKEKPCTRFRAASGHGPLDCDHGCATEFVPVGDCVGNLIVTDDLFPGVWRSCNETVAVLDIYGREPYPPTCSGKVIKTAIFPTDAVCRKFTNATTPILPVGDGQFYQMDCMTVFFPWIRAQLLAVGTMPAGLTSISSVNASTNTIVQLYEFNSSVAATPVAADNPADPNDGMLYFAGFNPKTKHSKIVSYEPRAKFGDWSFPSAKEQDFDILSLGFYRPGIYGCDKDDPRCGVFVVAKHPAGHIDVGEILATGDYNATSQHWPAGTPTAASAFANGAFFMQMAASPDGKSGLSVVKCALPGGTLSSAPLDEGYTIQTMVFDAGRDSLVAVVSKEPPVGVTAAALKTYYVALVGCGGAGRPCAGAVKGEPSPANGTVTTTGSFTAKPGYSILQGVSAWDQSSGQGNATLNIILQEDGRGAHHTYELVGINPWSGVVLHRAELANEQKVTIVQLGYA